jgi:ABC-type phosphate transport system permease subunit
VPITFGVIPTMIVATVAALVDVPEDLQLAPRTLGASGLYALWHVQVRAALPGIIAGALGSCASGRLNSRGGR